MFLGILETDKIDGNHFEKLRILLTQASLKSFELLEDYVRKAIEKRETALKDQTESKNNTRTPQN